MLFDAKVQTSSKAKNALQLWWRQNLLPNNARSVKTTTSYNSSYNNNINSNKIKHVSTPKPESRGILLYCVNHNVGVFLPAKRKSLQIYQNRHWFISTLYCFDVHLFYNLVDSSQVRLRR